MAKTKVIEMTREGIDKLKAELLEREGEIRFRISEDIERARAHGDISENSEYDDAKNAQAENEARIAEVKAILKNAKPIESKKLTTTKVAIGSKVTLQDLDSSDEFDYILVSSKEADLFNNKISNESPVGMAILGKKKGEVVEVSTPVGSLQYKIVKISKTK